MNHPSHLEYILRAIEWVLSRLCVVICERLFGCVHFQWNNTCSTLCVVFTGRKELNCEMMSLVVAAAWQDVVVEVRDEGQWPTVASTGSVNESLSGTVEVTERKLTFVNCLCGWCFQVLFLPQTQVGRWQGSCYHTQWTAENGRFCFWRRQSVFLFVYEISLGNCWTDLL